jgi:hypothetical protein
MSGLGHAAPEPFSYSETWLPDAYGDLLHGCDQQSFPQLRPHADAAGACASATGGTQ